MGPCIDDTDQTTQFTSNPLVTLDVNIDDSDERDSTIYEGRLTVTWLELFLDLSVVVTIHEVAVGLQEVNLKAGDFVNFVLRIFLLYVLEVDVIVSKCAQLVCPATDTQCERPL